MVVMAALVAECTPSGSYPPPSMIRAEAKQSGGWAEAPEEPRSAPYQVGTATWYGNAFAGRKTASGERFDPTQRTAAHRRLPFGTWVEVRRVDTGAFVRVRITDRGPYASRDRIIDLSKQAASDIDMIRSGTARVELRIVKGP
jgi:rare lipoprotein A